MLRMWHRERAASVRFCRDRRGAVGILVATGIVAFVGAAGLATDVGRGYMVKARLSQALDAAGLAGARVMFSATRDEDILMFFNANFPSEFMGATISGPTFTVDEVNQVITISATATIDTTFMKVLGFETLTVAAATEVTRAQELLEVVIAFDVSGSMADNLNGVPKITTARTAAVDLVNILFGDDEVKDLLKIGLVPWSSKVNVMLQGTVYDSALTTTQNVAAFTNPITGLNQTTLWYANNSPVPLLRAPAAAWRGGVYSRYIDNGIDDDADILLDGLTTATGSWEGWQPVINAEGEEVPGSNSSSSGRCNQPAPSPDPPSGYDCVNTAPVAGFGITPLTNVKTTITNAINLMVNPVGGTNLPLGFAWAWRVLMPSAPFTEAPVNPPTTTRQQAIVLMTDGENCGWYGDGYMGVEGICNSSARTFMDNRLRLVAANAKAMGVKVYAIQFGNAGGTQQQLMKDVATAPAAPYYFYAPTNAELLTAFTEVANNLSQLRLSK